VAPDRRSEIVDGFSRQARAFAQSPLQRDEARLRRLVEYLGPIPGERGLDVACGPGIVANALAARGVRMVGADLTQEMLRHAAETRASSGPPEGDGGIDLVRAVADWLPFAEGVFDFVVCRSSFHHFLDPPGALGQTARVTRRGGRVVIEDMIAPEDLIGRDEHEVIERLRDRTHVGTLTRSGFHRLIAQAGLGPAEELEFEMVIDFDEWMDRAFPAPPARDRARQLMEACLETPRGGRRAFLEGGRLKFVRRSLLLRAARS